MSRRADGPRPAEDGPPVEDGGSPVEIPVTGELDLHAFAPRDVPSVVEEYVAACRERGLTLLRLVHGRGKGVQRAVVRRVLAGLPGVRSFGDATSGSGGWGATVVVLDPSDQDHPDAT